MQTPKTSKYLLLFFTFALTKSIFSQVNSSDVFVRGYYKSDGTYVQPHYRSAPNATAWDNYSTIGNINPYTGEAGTVHPLSEFREQENEIHRHEESSSDSQWRDLTVDFPEMPEYALINNANVRVQPDSNSELLGVLTEGTVVHVISFGRSWLQVAYIHKSQYQIGFIPRSLLRKN